MTILTSLDYPGVTRVLKEVETKGLGKYVPYSQLQLDNNIDSLMLGGWSPLYMRVFNRLPQGTKIGVLWTSPLAQTEYSPVEMDYVATIKKLLDRGTLSYVWFGSEDWLTIFEDYKGKVFYAPYPLSWREVPMVERMDGHVGLFGPLHARKNILNQLAAVKFAEATVHLGEASLELVRFMDAMGIKYKLHGWMEDEEYYKTVASMRMGLQVSHLGVESFSYVCFDSLLMGVPCLTSVDWAPPLLRVSPTDIKEMANLIRFGWGSNYDPYPQEQLRKDLASFIVDRNTKFLEGFEVMR